MRVMRAAVGAAGLPKRVKKIMQERLKIL